MMAAIRAMRATATAVMRRQRGAAAIEFAVLIPVVVTALTGVAIYGRAMYEKMELVSAARAGAQQAVLDRTDTAAIKNAVVNSTNLGLTTADVTTTETCLCSDGTAITCGLTCADSDPNHYYMTVTANYTHTLMLLGTTMNLSGSVKIRTK